ncbi:methyl-accepting chemotaxis protein [Erwinia tracheiphila]|uniref:methyl-accepting chemotaxis protein n=1 Tax=Erwinia tracheiphila TaxID=65700 RepID=UPI00033CE3E1|nr:methyl-accepting chemotaxis protein [Erwinia tracheiphila]EOS93200.1 methyl-accepting chemotaxis protein IV, peptide sensor receptor [Erwinia tracheiphila PSU-1]UIA89953.1 methyl-accepting chemotaxis protein [Erwinia tracheiphila]UIA98257.1 methyl-accepting chemotaxis protein [Erwinia tracheiphila]
MFSRIRIATVILFLLGLFCVMQIVGSGLSFNSFRLDARNMHAVEVSSNQRETLGQTWAALLSACVTLSRAGTLAALSKPREQIISLMTRTQEDLNAADKAYREFDAIGVVSPEGQQLKQVMAVEYHNYYQELAQLITYLQNNQLQNFLDSPTQGKQDKFQGQYNLWMAHIDKMREHASQAGEGFYRQSKVIFIAAVLTSLLVTLAGIVWVRKVVIAPLTLMRGHFERIAAGDLGGHISANGRNELSQLFNSLHVMQTALASTVSSVRDGSHEMHTGIHEMASGNNDLSARTEQQAASLTETAASMEQLTATVSGNAENARLASQLAKDASNTANRGGTLTDKVVTTMNDIAASSKKIGDITSVIDGIAFQTNILALNAAVEAARAGEQGRGFAVVAGEVRSLAQRSAQAAREIKVLIEESVNRVEQGSALVASAGETMDEIVQSVTRVNDIMGEIASASDEQRRGIEQVARAVSQMDQVTQQNAALVEQAAAATEALEAQADHLTQAVKKFTLSSADEMGQPLALDVFRKNSLVLTP